MREVEEAIRLREESRPTKPSTPRATKLRPPGLLELEELLGDYLETRVGITMSPRRGRVEVEFATLEDLERIYRVITEGNRRHGVDGPDETQVVTSIGVSIPRRRPTASAAASSGPCAISAAAPAGSSREKSSHTTAAMRVSRSSRYVRPVGSSTRGSTDRRSWVMPCATHMPPSLRKVWLAK